MDRGSCALLVLFPLSVEEALRLALRLGPLGRALREHPALEDDVAVAVRDTLSKYVTPSGCRRPPQFGLFWPATTELLLAIDTACGPLKGGVELRWGLQPGRHHLKHDLDFSQNRRDMVKRDLRTIVFDVSSYGFGHLGQIAPVIVELIAQDPTARVVVRSTHAASVVNNILGFHVDLDEPPPEATLVMLDPTAVDVAASAEAYRALHARWDDDLERETARLEALSPVALVADVPYLSLAAAKRLGIPAVALCSLNWLDLYRTYCGCARDAPAIIRTIEAAYCSAHLFLQPRPHMPMSDLPNRRSIGPIARIGRAQKNQVRTILGIPQTDYVVLVTFGGIRSEKRVQLPNIAGVHWIALHSVARGNVADVSRFGMSFIDVLASSDAVVTKIGYATFVEAACNGVGIVSAPRADWPEAGPLIEWAKQNANFALMEDGIEDTPGFRTALSAVLNAPCRMPVRASGIAEAVETIAGIAGLS